MTTSRRPKADVHVGGFTISPFDRGSVWVTDKEGRGGNFPRAAVSKALKAKDPEKALREYFDRAYP